MKHATNRSFLTLSVALTAMLGVMAVLPLRAGSLDGTLTVLHSFDGTKENGSRPWTRMVEGVDGAFYGTTHGGNYIAGNVYRITSTGDFTSLHHFGDFNPDGSYDGATPAANLIKDGDGNLYGTLDADSGSNVYKITPGGAVTILYRFPVGSSYDQQGHTPTGLVLAADGKFYGTNANGGANGLGTVFQLTTNGTMAGTSVKVLYTFRGLENNNALTNDGGANPRSPLVQGKDGAFYGTAVQGGANGAGTVFGSRPTGSSLRCMISTQAMDRFLVPPTTRRRWCQMVCSWPAMVVYTAWARTALPAAGSSTVS
jgi:uncharacterized repeat protein (TIGR03803 family)